MAMVMLAFQMLGLERGEPEVSMALGPLAAVLLGAVLPSVIKAAGSVVSSRRQSDASRAATQAQTDANRRAEDWEREQDALDRAERKTADEENQRRWDTEVARDQARYNEQTMEDRRRWAADERWKETRDRRLGPYRSAGVGALQQLGSLAGITITPLNDTPDMTGGWDSRLAPSTELPPETVDPSQTGPPTYRRRPMSTLASGQ